MITEDEFLDNLMKIAKKLENGEITVLSELRRFERELDLAEIYGEWSKNETKFLAYSMKQIIGDIWRNFAVDTPIELEKTTMENLCRVMGSCLVKIIEKFNKNGICEEYKLLSNIFNEIYLTVIESNKKLYGVN